MRRIAIIAFVAALAAFTASSGSATHALTGVNIEDQMFVKVAGQAGAAEIKASRVALTKSTNQSTLAFARRMITDHRLLAAKLKLVAGKNGLVAASTPSAAQAAQIAALARLSGTAFDLAYSRGQVAAHVAAVALFTAEARNGGSPSLRAAARAALPLLRMHLSMARNLAADVPMQG